MHLMVTQVFELDPGIEVINGPPVGYQANPMARFQQAAAETVVDPRVAG